MEGERTHSAIDRGSKETGRSESQGDEARLEERPCATGQTRPLRGGLGARPSARGTLCPCIARRPDDSFARQAERTPLRIESAADDRAAGWAHPLALPLRGKGCARPLAR